MFLPFRVPDEGYFRNASIVNTKLDNYVFNRKYELLSTLELYIQLLFICRVGSNLRSSWIWRSSSLHPRH